MGAEGLGSMELLFRKYFWVVNLAFLLAAAFLAAKTVNVFLAARLTPLPQLNLQQGAPPPAPPPARTELSPEALSKITGIPLPEPEEVPVESAGPEQPSLDEQEAVKTGLRLRLVGTLVANRPEWCMANIEDVTNHEVKVYMVGDQVQTATILEIQRLRVLINNGGRKEFIDMEPGDGSQPVAVAPPAPVPHAAVPAAPPGPAGAGIRALSDDNYEVQKAEVDKALSNLNDIAMQARIVPAFKDGVSTGFKLFSIRPDSLYSKIGIQNGDVIKRINGFEMNSPEKALEIYSKLKESSRIEIEMERNGSTVRKSYTIRP